MDKAKRISYIIMIIFAVVVALSVYTIYGVSKEAKKIEVQKIDLSNSNDGKYEGEYSIDPVKVLVEVEIKGKKITNIKLKKHENGIGFRAEKPLIQSIIEKQNTDVDAVSGATISSKAILKAVEIAVNKSK